MPDIEDKRLLSLAKKLGSENASRFLTVLGKNKSFYNAIETSVGQELLKDAVAQIESRLSMIIAEEDNEQVRAEIRAYMSIINRWSKIINKYRDDLVKFSKLTL